MYAVKAVYDGVSFKPRQPIPVNGQYEVVITFLEPVAEVKEKNPRILIEPDPNKATVLGLWDGEIKIPDDFNEPLDEMMEYMY